jgi:hypothetical protein
MNDDMNDDRMDKRLFEGVRDYNAPGSVPREAMWERIREARGAAAPLANSGRGGWRWVGAGLAAAAVLAIGIGIGQRMGRTTEAPASTPAVTVAAKVDSAAVIIGKLREATKGTDRRVRELAAAERPAEPRGSNRSLGDSQAAGVNSMAYQLVVLQHLAGTEAMITSFRASAKRGEMDAQLAGWSRELLSTTRMLESSTATRDPVMKRLLEDLDLVIAQILQYSTHGTNNPEELDLIEQSINKRGVIAKLRSTLPGRTPSAGT